MKFTRFNKQNILSEQTFEKFFSLLEKVLPANEHRNKSEQYKLFNNNCYNIIAVSSHNCFAGFIAYWDLGEFCFIEHLCISPDFQSKGLGSALIKHLSEISDKSFVLEAEPQGTAVSDRRIRFYTRCGFYLSDTEYYQMPLSIDDEPLKLQIMYRPMMGKARLQRFIAIIKKTVYNA